MLMPHVVHALAELAKLGVQAEIFGSFAWGDFDERSDIDFLITDERDVSIGIILQTIERSLPARVEIDMVLLSCLLDSSARCILGQLALHASRRVVVNSEHAVNGEIVLARWRAKLNAQQDAPSAGDSQKAPAKQGVTPESEAVDTRGDGRRPGDT